jgi:tyrosine-protein kinase Etk/Wzc
VAQYEMNLRDYWLIIRRRRLIIIASTVLVALFSFWFARQKVPVYQSTAAVRFEQSTQLSGLLVEVLSYSSSDNIETQVTLIKSYLILEEVAKRLGRLPGTASGEMVRESKGYWAALDAIGSKVKVARVPSTSILEITVTSTNPREARDIANAVADVYRGYNRQQRNLRVTEARKFIETQLKEAEARVKRAESEVWAFREANRIISPGAESTVLLSLFTQVRSDIEKARQQRTELELVQGRLTRTDPANASERVFIDTTNPAMQKLQTMYSELLLERNNLALEVTDRHPRLQALDDRLREVRVEMRREVGAQIAALRTREEILNRQMGDLLQKNREVPTVEMAMQRLLREAKNNDDLLALLKAKHQEALIKESETIEEVSIVRPATESDTPVGAEALNTVLVGALLGLSLGLVLAFVQETLDTSIGTIEDVEAYLEVPVLGVVPHIDSRETVQRILERRPALASMDPEALLSHALLITHFDPKSPVAEAYRTLRTNVQFARMERSGKILVITSPTLQEGKTTTIVNLALTLAQSGQRTLLIGGNMRRPSIHRFFGIEREPGLSDILVGSTPWRDCVRTVADILMGRFEMEDIMAAPGLDNLHIIEAGPIPANPSELLSTPKMTEFLRAVRDEYDIVLIDTPPVLPVTDSAIVASQADGVILVYQAGKVGRLVLKRAKIHIENVGGKVWGVVLNDVKTEIAGYAYTHYYTHYYGEETVIDTHKERLRRAGALFKRLLRRDRRGEPGGAPSSAAGASEIAPPEEAQPDLEPPATSAGEIEPTQADLAPPATRASTFRRASALLKNLVRRGGRGEATSEPSTEGEASWTDSSSAAQPDLAPAATGASEIELDEGAPTAQRSTTRRRITLLIILIIVLAGAILWGVFGWRLSGWLGSQLRPRALFLQKLQTPLAPVPAPVAPSLPAFPPALPPDREPAPAPEAALSPPPAAASPAENASAAASPIEKPGAASPVFGDTPKVVGKAGGVGRPEPVGPAARPSAVAALEAPPPPARARFTVELGPFLLPGEAERVERQLNQAGYQTARFRRQTGAAVFAVIVEKIPTARDAQALVASLRDEGLGGVVVLGEGEPLRVRVGTPLPLRAAVQVAERLRAAGHHVRVAAQPGEAATFVIRHGNFTSAEEAQAKSRDLVGLGLANQVVRVK